MTIQGSLSDLGIIELIQFAHRCRQAGVLSIAGQGREAKLYYSGEGLVHAVLDDCQGLEALVRIVDWGEGAFEFQQGVPSPGATIEMDTTQAIMTALQLADERRAGLDEPQEEAPEDIFASLVAEADSFLEKYAAAQRVLILDDAGARMLDRARRGAESAGDPLVASLCSLVAQACGETGLSRAFLESEQGNAAAARLPQGFHVLLIAERSAPLGAVAMALGKLAGGLEPIALEFHALSQEEQVSVFV